MYYGVIIQLYVILVSLVGRGFGKNCYQSTSSSSSITYYPVTPNEINITECNMKAATHVYLRGNGALFWSLETLPLYMFDGTNVRYIYSSSVGLQYLHNGIFQPIKRSLKYIVMENNLFYNFPSNAFYELEKLQYIYMRNQLGKGMKRCYFPPGLGLVSLKIIDLSGNQLETAEFNDLKTEHLKTLQLDSNALTVLDLSEIHNIKYLYARQNLLENITETSFMSSRHSLQYVYLSNNKLTSQIWNSLLFTNNLRELDLRKNNITFIKPLVINMLTNLTWLDLSQNSIVTLHDVQFRNNKLTHLFLNGNNIKNLPNGCITKTSFADPWGGTLAISGNDIQGSVSLTIPKCNGGCSLDLSINKISDFMLHYPTETKLSLLNISYNKLVKIQTRLPPVNRFDVSHNRLNTNEILHVINSSLSMATQVEMENIGLFCDMKFNVEDDLEFEFDNLEVINLGRNCVPLDFLCKIKFKKWYRMTKIAIDRNMIVLRNENSKSTCPSLSGISASYSMIDMSLEVTDLIELLFNNSNTVLSRPLTSLWLRHNNIHSIPHLNFWYNRLSSFNEQMQIDFMDNKLTAMPNITVNFGDKLIYLSGGSSIEFNFGQNFVNKMYQIDFQLNNVYTYNFNIRLNLSRNRINEVDLLFHLGPTYFIDELNFISIYLDLSFNEINMIDFKRCIQTSNPILKLRSTDINLSHNQLSSLLNCDELQASYLTKVDISYNSVTQFDGCKTVHDLNLSFNKISYIQANFSSEVLRTLNLQHNLISSIHALAFNRSTMIQTLNLQENQLEEIPEALAKLMNLQYLDLSLNKIQIMNNVNLFRELRYLRTLILTRNAFIPTVREGTLPTHGHSLHCDCSLLVFRNNSLEVQGRCATPPEVRGYHVSCFPINKCPKSEPLYVHPNTIAKCQTDVFTDLTMIYTTSSQESTSAFNTVSITMGSLLFVSVVVNCIALLFVFKQYRSQTKNKNSSKTRMSTASETYSDGVHQGDHFYDGLSNTPQNQKTKVPKPRSKAQKENVYEVTEGRTEFELHYVNAAFTT